MTHTSLYKSKRRMEKATEIQKATSTFQRKMNSLNKMLQEQIKSNQLKKLQLQNVSKFLDKLIYENRIKKEEISEFLMSKQKSMEILEKQQDKNDETIKYA